MVAIEIVMNNIRGGLALIFDPYRCGPRTMASGMGLVLWKVAMRLEALMLRDLGASPLGAFCWEMNIWHGPPTEELCDYNIYN